MNPLNNILLFINGEIVGKVQKIEQNKDGTVTLTKVDGTSVTGMCTYK